MTEAQLQAAVLELCRLRGLLAYHTRDSRRSARGFPDLVIAGPGGHLFAELKSEHGTTTADQDFWASVLIQCGARWFLWRPSDLADGTIDFVLSKLRYPKPPSTS